MRTVANMFLVNQRTKQPELYIDYANTSSVEFSSESVYATAGGANAIRWDKDKTGTLTVETELFDLSLLQMIMGSDRKEGIDSIFQQKRVVLGADMNVKLGTTALDPATITIVKLKSAEDSEFDGAPLYNGSAAQANLPKQVKDVTVSVNATTARITFQPVSGVKQYEILRNGNSLTTISATSYTDSKLTAETQYEYEVRAINQFGKGPKSAKVKPTTSAAGVTDLTTFKATTADKNAAANNTGELVTPAGADVSYSYADGTITFTGAAIGDAYSVSYMEQVDNVRTLKVVSDKFPDSYEIFGESKLRERNTGVDRMVQIHYYNVKPQSNFTLSQSASDPTSLSIVFDVFPKETINKETGEVEKLMMDYKIIQ